MGSELRWKEQCPESRQSVYYPIARCNLNDKPCVLESGYECPYYDDFLGELEEKEENNFGYKV